MSLEKAKLSSLKDKHELQAAIDRKVLEEKVDKELKSKVEKLGNIKAKK